jgi:hypothetical protein
VHTSLKSAHPLCRLPFHQITRVERPSPTELQLWFYDPSRAKAKKASLSRMASRVSLSVTRMSTATAPLHEDSDSSLLFTMDQSRISVLEEWELKLRYAKGLEKYSTS